MKFVQLRSLRDLIMLVASSQSSGVIQHLVVEGAHIYFIVGGTLHEMFLYCVKQGDPVKGQFITYNTYSGEVGASEKMQHEPNQSSFPVVEILNQDLLPRELLGTLGEL